jgi:hypothetical protein
MKPKVFIGSTSEGKKYAKIIEGGLRDVAEPTVWYNGVFEISGNTQSNLIKVIRNCDFVVIILTADDTTSSRGSDFFSPRDNLLFEAGIGFGAINPDRTFLVPEYVYNLKIPSDLLGFTLCHPFKKTDDPKSSIAAAFDQIEERIKEKGCRSSIKIEVGKEKLTASTVELIKAADRNIIMFGRDLSWANIYSDAIREKVGEGVEVEVFTKKPDSEFWENNILILEQAGARVYRLAIDPGIKLTMIDHEDLSVARFMISTKERRAMGAEEPYKYICEIHDAKDSRVLWNTLKRFYESFK